jgi:hypothetical protein
MTDRARLAALIRRYKARRSAELQHCTKDLGRLAMQLAKFAVAGHAADTLQADVRDAWIRAFVYTPRKGRTRESVIQEAMVYFGVSRATVINALSFGRERKRGH